MRSKSWILLAIALGFGLVASVAISQVVFDSRGVKAETPMIDVLVAIKDIDAASKLTKDNVKPEKWPKDRVPPGAIGDFKEVDGKYANQSLFQGEPIVKKKLINAVESISHSIPKGYKLFDLAVDEKNGGIGYVKPGDRVDVFGFFEKGGRIPETKSMVIVENVTVKAVDGNAVRDNGEQGNKATKTIQLLIRDSQYEAVNTASNLGKLRVALRPPSEEEQGNEDADNGLAFLGWIKTAEKSSDAPTAGSSPKTAPVPMLGTFKSPEPQPVSEMVVISPSGLSKYQWKNENGLPELVTPNGKGSSPASGGQMVSGTLPGNMVWNPSSGSWTTSGFSPSYPGADGSASKKKQDQSDSAQE